MVAAGLKAVDATTTTRRKPQEQTMLSPTDQQTLAIAKATLALAKAMDGTANDLSRAHGAMADACESAGQGGLAKIRSEVAVEVLRLAVVEKYKPATIGGLLVAIEEAHTSLDARL
jgi:hypothetical protein